MSNEMISAVISLAVAIIVLIASYFQWWNIEYGGGMSIRGWVKFLFAILIIALVVALFLILLQLI